MTMRVNVGRSAPKPWNSDSNSGITKISKIVVTISATTSHRSRIEQRFFDFLLDGLGLFLVRCDFIEQGLECTGLFTGGRRD